MKLSTHQLTLIAVLAAMSAVGRIFFQQVPSGQPTTAIIILSGFFLGPTQAMILAALTTYLSNMMMGMGLWTLWQILAWSMIGLIAGLIGKVVKKHAYPVLISFGVLSGFIYGLFFALINFIVSGKFWGYYLAGVMFDLNHAISNIIFIVVLYKPFLLLFKRFNHQQVRTRADIKKR